MGIFERIVSLVLYECETWTKYKVREKVRCTGYEVLVNYRNEVV